MPRPARIRPRGRRRTSEVPILLGWVAIDHAHRSRLRPWKLRDSLPSRRRRDGRGLSRPRSADRPRRGDQGASHRGSRSSGPAPTFRTGGARRGQGQPSESADRLRRRRPRRLPLPGVRAAGGPHATGTDGRRDDSAAARGGVRRPDRERTGRGACQRHHPSRSEAGEHLHHRRGSGQAARLRPGQAVRRDGACR